MSLMEMSFSGAVLILVILAVRAALKGWLPKRTFAALWMVALLRLLVPFSIPSSWSVYTLSANALSGLENAVPGLGNVISESGNEIPGSGNAASESGNKMPGSGNAASESGNEIPGLGNATSESGNKMPGSGNAASESGNEIPGLRNAVSESGNATSGSENPKQDEAAGQTGNSAGTVLRQDLQPEKSLRSEQSPQPRQRFSLRQNTESSSSADTSEEMLFVTEQTAARPYMGRNLWKILRTAGTLICLIFFAGVYWSCSREFRMSLPVKTDILGNWHESHPLRRKLSVRRSDQIASPVSYGIRHPVILLSKSVLSGSAIAGDRFRLRYVLEHEYVHIQYFDAAVKLLMVLALCIHWFNPFVYLMYIFLNRDLELACDETVVRRFGEEQRSAYAMALIEMEEEKSGLLPLGNSFSKNAIEERIRAIMKIKKMSPLAHGLSVVLVCGITLLFATSCSTFGETENIKQVKQDESRDLKTQEVSADDQSIENYSKKETEGQIDAIDQAIQAQENVLNQINKLYQEIQKIEEDKEPFADPKTRKNEEDKKKYAALEQKLQNKEEELRQLTDQLQDITGEMEKLQEQRESLRLVQGEINRDEFFDKNYGKYGIHYEISENKLYKDNLPVRFFVDEKKGGVLWASNEGDILVEAVYDDKGNLKKLSVEDDVSQQAVEAALEAAAQEAMTWQEVETAEKVLEAAGTALKQGISAARSISQSSIFSSYQKFGLSYDEKQDCLMYENKAVGYFKDETSPGMYIRFVEKSGDLGVVVKRNNRGEIICLRTVPFDENAVSDAEVTETGEAVLSQGSSAADSMTQEAVGSSARDSMTQEGAGSSAGDSIAQETEASFGGADTARNTYVSYRLEDWESELRKEYREHGMTLDDRKTDRWTYNGKEVAVIYDKLHWIYTNEAASGKNSVCLEVVRDHKDQIRELKEVTREEIQKRLEEE